MANRRKTEDEKTEEITSVKLTLADKALIRDVIALCERAGFHVSQSYLFWWRYGNHGNLGDGTPR